MPDKMAASGVEAESPVSKCITVLEKKIRNLEKRKGKLDLYRKTTPENAELNKDQKEAIAKYDLVLQNIDFAKELQKHFADISVEVEKSQKKQAKREKVERHQQETQRLQDVLRLNSVLNALGSDSVREDFRAGKYPSVVLTDDNLQQLDDFYQILFPTRDVDQTSESFGEQLITASEHLVSYVDRQDKKVLSTTYKDMHDLVDRINGCEYFEKNSKVETEIQAPVEVPQESEQYEEEPASDVERVSEEREESMEPENIRVASSGSSDALNEHVRPVGHTSTQQSDSYHPTHWPHSAVLATQQPTAVLATNVTTGMNVMASSQVERPPSVGFSDGAYYSGFAKQRPLQEIVSSLKGSYNFLQESQIDPEGHAQGQSSSNVYSSYDSQNSSGQPSSFNASQQQQPVAFGPQGVIDQSAAIHASSQPHFDHDPAQPTQIFHAQGTPTGAYGVQGLHHSVYAHHQMAHEPGFDPNYPQIEKAQYNFMDHQPYVLTPLNPNSDPAPSHVAGMNAVSTAGPQPIPLPGQAIHGQSLTEQGFSAGQQQPPADITDAMVKKQFTMNPNANIFRSAYEESSPGPSDQIKSEISPPAVGAGDGQVLRTFAQTASANFQGGGANRGFSTNFGSGGPPQRGSGPSRGGRGRDAGLNNGVQSGGRGGGPMNASRGGLSNVGSNGQRGGGGVRGGMPRGGTGNPRGSSSGGGRGFGRNNSQQSSHEQATHA